MRPGKLLPPAWIFSYSTRLCVCCFAPIYPAWVLWRTRSCRKATVVYPSSRVSCRPRSVWSLAGSLLYTDGTSLVNNIPRHLPRFLPGYDLSHRVTGRWFWQTFFPVFLDMAGYARWMKSCVDTCVRNLEETLTFHPSCRLLLRRFPGTLLSGKNVQFR